MTDWTPDSCAGLAEVSGETLRPGGLELTGYLFDLGNFHAESRILDAGCGMGATLRYLAQTRKLIAVGVDSSQAMIAAARRHSPELPLICAGLESLPFGEADFDGIICECVLSLTVAATVLKEFHRVLSPGGLLLVTDLYRRSPGRNPGGDGQLVTREQIEAMMDDAGFAIEHWEDRTRELRMLAVRLIMAPGSTGENLPGGCFFNEAEAGIDRRDMGYHLLVARKTTL